MFSESVNKAGLSEVAAEFKESQVKHSLDYPEAKNVPDRASALLNKAINGNIESPWHNGFLAEEFRGKRFAF